MTALRKFQIADVRARQTSRRLASPSCHPGRALRPQRRAGNHSALARALRLGAAVLFGLWGLAALGFCAAVAVALIW
jgi:hypothetical protein